MTRALLLPLAVLLALATGVGLLGVAATVRQAPVVVVATATAGTAAAATPGGAATPEPELFAADVVLPSPGGPVALRVARLTLAPGAALPPERAAAPTALIAELGEVGVRTYAYVVGAVGQLEGVQVDTVLRRGDHLIVDPGTVRRVRNAGPTPAVILVLAIEAAAVTPTSHSTIAPEPCRPGFC